MLEVFDQTNAGPALAQQTVKRRRTSTGFPRISVPAQSTSRSRPSELNYPLTCSDIRSVLVALARFSAISLLVHSQMVGDSFARFGLSVMRNDPTDFSAPFRGAIHFVAYRWQRLQRTVQFGHDGERRLE